MDERIEQRAAIKFCVRLKKTFAETKQLIDEGFGEGVVSRSTIHTWYKRFKDGRQSLEDDERTGRPLSAVNEKNEQRLRELVMRNRHMSLRRLAEELNISKNSVARIWKEKMHHTKDSNNDVYVPIDTLLETSIKEEDDCLSNADVITESDLYDGTTGEKMQEPDQVTTEEGFGEIEHVDVECIKCEIVENTDQVDSVFIKEEPVG